MVALLSVGRSKVDLYSTVSVVLGQCNLNMPNADSNNAAGIYHVITVPPYEQSNIRLLFWPPSTTETISLPSTYFAS